MKVILKEDVRKLGKKGQVVEVSDGYGRNYLISRGLAVEATASTMKVQAERDAAERRKDEKLRAEAESVKARIAGKVVRVSIPAGEGGKLFGAVTSAQIAEALGAQYGVSVDKKDVKLDGVIKALGGYPLTLKLHPAVDASMTVSVEAQ
ncbi:MULTISPECIES: 50S ribosomal protein L9 [Jonquetella]|uniref:Large ribosomal subunit protein bL9 n=1 Tax=Jonquetella anthropi DSM 22815 TaxID=885272 RepID=H0ULU6_9BACT|nr:MULTISPECIES: 50S ribosomal protein L9 [Jonquetella]EEX48153.1 ribosomal protein L9 [Jonquetella anthropi E3_33 E1]EHM13587.1 ribosomal protein L9 [Jonquetella anthropi DSM 22815]ERL24369.1 ribosomal protein L9 [Jonquetella sp. BV3C21]